MTVVVAYTPKAAYENPDALGSVFVNDDTSVNVRELVTGSADGVFVVSDEATIAALDQYEVLKRVRLPEHAPQDPGSGAPAVDLDKLTKPELLRLPEAKGVEGAKDLHVDKLRDAIRATRG